MGYNRPRDPASHADRVMRAAQSASAAAVSTLAAAWSRSLHFHGLAPDDPARKERVGQRTLKEALERTDRLRAIASGVMDRLFAAAGDSGCCVVLSDDKGLVLDRRGAAGDDEDFARWGLWTGNDWSEMAEGANGIGTCAVEERPVMVHRDEHFASRNTALSCAGAPIFDHDGELAAVLDVSTCRADASESMMRLTAHAVADAARRIESENFQAAFAGCRILIGDQHGAGGAMLLAADRDDLLVGATRKARRVFGLDEESFRAPRPVSDILNERRDESDLAAAERAEIRRALARAGGNASAAARDLGVSRATLYRRMERLGVRRPGASA